MLGFMKKKKEETISYGVIGLGKFGYTLAIQLAEYGYDFLVVDKDENLVQDLRTVTESAIVVDDYDKKSIKAFKDTYFMYQDGESTKRVSSFICQQLKQS